MNGQEIAVKRILEDKWRQIGREESNKLLNDFITELVVMHTHPAENILPIMAVRYIQSGITRIYQYNLYSASQSYGINF